MIHIIENYYMTFTEANITLYEKRKVKDKTTGEVSDKEKMVLVSYHSPHLTVGLPSLYKKLLKLLVCTKTQQEVEQPLMSLVDFIKSESEVVKDAARDLGFAITEIKQREEK